MTTEILAFPSDQPEARKTQRPATSAVLVGYSHRTDAPDGEAAPPVATAPPAPDL